MAFRYDGLGRVNASILGEAESVQHCDLRPDMYLCQGFQTHDAGCITAARSDIGYFRRFDARTPPPHLPAATSAIRAVGIAHARGDTHDPPACLSPQVPLHPQSFGVIARDSAMHRAGRSRKTERNPRRASGPGPRRDGGQLKSHSAARPTAPAGTPVTLPAGARLPLAGSRR